MRKIKDLVKKPSEALHAMINGLEHAKRVEGFVIDMNTYGECRVLEKQTICFGCAATCTVMEISGVTFEPISIDYRKDRAIAANFETEDLRAFEFAINEARRGDMRDLFTFFDIDYSAFPLEILYPPFALTTADWEEQIEAVNTYCGELEELGL